MEDNNDEGLSSWDLRRPVIVTFDKGDDDRSEGPDRDVDDDDDRN